MLSSTQSIGKLTSDISTVRGTLRFLAPEIIEGTIALYSKNTDVWAFGSTIYVRDEVSRPCTSSLTNLKELITKQYPYAGLNDAGVILAITRGSLPEWPPTSITAEREPVKLLIYQKLKAICNQCWERNGTNRPQMKKIRDTLQDVKLYLFQEHFANLFRDVRPPFLLGLAFGDRGPSFYEVFL